MNMAVANVAAEKLPSFIGRKRKEKYGRYGYDPSYCQIAYDLLANSDEAMTKTHVCVELLISKPTLIAWMQKYQDFYNAIQSGLQVGELKWRKKIAKHAWEPGAKVNNGLIKLLSSSVYGIKEDIEPQVVIQNTTNLDPITIMHNRGIPVPQIGVADIDDE